MLSKHALHTAGTLKMLIDCQLDLNPGRSAEGEQISNEIIIAGQEREE